VLTEHPQATPIFVGGATAAPPAVVPITDAVVGRLRAGGLDEEAALRTSFALFDYMLGFTLAVTRSAERSGDLAGTFSEVDPERLPAAAAVAPFVRRFTADRLYAGDEQFEFGLVLLMAACEKARRLGAKESPGAGAACRRGRQGRKRGQGAACQEDR
jgi:hypothetical protein